MAQNANIMSESYMQNAETSCSI